MAEGSRQHPAEAVQGVRRAVPVPRAPSRPSLGHRALAGAVALARAEAVLLALLAFTGLYFAYRWSIDLRRPSGPEHEGWRGYTDQGYYLLEAKYLAQLDPIPREIFFYGPGYPALAVPFAGIGLYGWPFEDPFLPANLAIFLLAVTATYLVGRRLLGEWAGVAAGLALVFATPLVRFVTLPWNSTVCLGAVALTLLVALRPRVGPLEAAVLGVAVGFAYSARYVDALWLAIIVVAVLLARVPRERASWRVLGGLVCGAAIPLVPTFYLHWRVFGNPFTQTYTFHHNVGRAQFDVWDIPSHGLQAFVSPYFFGDEPTKASPLLAMMFLLLFAPLGAWFVLRAARGPRLIIGAGYALASALATLFYLSYYFTDSVGLSYGSLHFLKMWWPPWTIAAVAGVAGVVRRAVELRQRAT